MSKRPDGPRKRPKMNTRTRALARARRRTPLQSGAPLLPQLRQLAVRTTTRLEG